MDEQILERAGCRLHYWQVGDPAAPLIVLTHGAGADHRMFDAQIPALTPSHRVLTWDVRGHGLSRPAGGPFSSQAAVEDLLALLDAVGRPQAILVGQSMGGNISQEVAFRRPERVRALIVVGSTCNTGRLAAVEKLTNSDALTEKNGAPLACCGLGQEVSSQFVGAHPDGRPGGQARGHAPTPDD
ncbi:MAG: alpha/beta hydrolase [Chloroflexi bacterium]|nr:alpha/beta hydrolase [Chloroflexota bacterium]